MSMLNYLVYFLVISISAFFGLLIYVKNTRSPLNRHFSLFIFATCGWAFTLFLLYESSQAWALLFGRLNFVFTEMIAYFGFYFGYFFPIKIFSLRKIIHYILGVWTFFLIIITQWSGLIDKEELVTTNGVRTIFGPLYIIFILHFVILISAIFILPILKYRKVNRRQKQQIKYFVLGSSLSIIFAAITNILFPFVFAIYKYQIIGPVAFFFFFGLTSYAIVKHQLLDIRIVIQRGIIYSFSLGIIIGFYIALLLLFQIFFGALSQEGILLSAGITIILGIYGTPFIEKYFRRRTDRIFFKDKYDYQEAVYGISEVLNQNMSLRALIEKMCGKLQSILKVKFVEMIIPGYNLKYDRNKSFKALGEDFSSNCFDFIKEKKLSFFNYSDISYLLEQAKEKNDTKTIKHLKAAKEYGKKYGIAASTAIIIKGRLFGIISLGERRSGDIFTADDINLLKTLSHQAATALEKADLYEEVKSYSEELEKKVEKRTAEIKGLQEGQKQMMLEIAHGLQTPLTIIKGELSYLYKQIKDNNKIASLERTVDRTSKFIYDMLRIANLDANSKKLKLEPLSLSELLFDQIEGLKIITEDKKIAIISKIEPGVYIKGDQSSLEELISNLASNSVKYMKETGERKIIVELKKENKQAVLKIEDTGIGIAKENLAKLFSRFYRADNRKEGRRDGTGLGLAICQRIAKAHNGRISVTSELDKGTKFTIVFPLL